MDDETLRTRLFRLEVRSELENKVGTYAHLLAGCAGEKILDELWAQRGEITLEIGASGKYIGREKVATYYQKDHIPGKFLLMLATSPVIEVAKDGNSARGLWLTIGTETDAGELGEASIADPGRKALLSSRTPAGEAYQAEWAFQKLGIDFVCEDGQWKFLHVHIFEIMRAPYDRDWVRYAVERFATDGIRLDMMFQSNLPYAEDKPPENLASRPTEYHWQYKVDSLTETAPLPPQPYESLNEKNCF